MKKLDVRIYLVAILVLTMVLTFLISCSKDDINNALSNTVTVTTAQASHDCDTLWIGGYTVSSVSRLTWGGVEQWQAIVKPEPQNTPAKTRRTHSLVTDSLELNVGDRLVLIRIN